MNSSSVKPKRKSMDLPLIYLKRDKLFLREDVRLRIFGANKKDLYKIKREESSRLLKVYSKNPFARNALVNSELHEADELLRKRINSSSSNRKLTKISSSINNICKKFNRKIKRMIPNHSISKGMKKPKQLV